MSNQDTLAGIKTLVEFVAEVAMWKQKAVDLEKERDYLRERITSLEQRFSAPAPAASKPEAAAEGEK